MPEYSDKPGRKEKMKYKYYINRMPFNRPAKNMVNEVLFDEEKIIENIPEYELEYCYGYVEYSKLLTKEELKNYDLIAAEEILVECEYCNHADWLHEYDMIEAYGKIVCKDCLHKVITEKLKKERRFLDRGTLIIWNGMPAEIYDYVDYPDHNDYQACREYDIMLWDGDIIGITEKDIAYVFDGIFLEDNIEDVVQDWRMKLF